jgi:hypothetical protein
MEKLKEFWNEFKTGISSVDFASAGKDIADKIKTGLGLVTDYAKSIYDKIKSGWDAWIAADGPKNLGVSFAKAVVKGVVDLGKWIYGKIEDYWTSIKTDGGSLHCLNKLKDIGAFWRIFERVKNEILQPDEPRFSVGEIQRWLEHTFIFTSTSRQFLDDSNDGILEFTKRGHNEGNN